MTCCCMTVWLRAYLNPALMLQVTQIRIAGDPSYDTRYAFIEFMTPEEVRWCP